MTTAWTITALNALVTELENDAVLATYVDTVELGDVDRADDAPDFTRHGIRIVPLGLESAEVFSPVTTLERFRVGIHLYVLNWDPVNPIESITGTTVVGVGTSEVGIVQFVEDVCNALRLNTLSDLLEETGVEVEKTAIDFSRVVNGSRDRVFRECVLTWTGEHISNMERS